MGFVHIINPGYFEPQYEVKWPNNHPHKLNKGIYTLYIYIYTFIIIIYLCTFHKCLNWCSCLFGLHLICSFNVSGSSLWKSLKHDSRNDREMKFCDLLRGGKFLWVNPCLILHFFCWRKWHETVSFNSRERDRILHRINVQLSLFSWLQFVHSEHEQN